MWLGSFTKAATPAYEAGGMVCMSVRGVADIGIRSQTQALENNHDLTAHSLYSKSGIFHKLASSTHAEAWSRISNHHSTRGVHGTLCLGFGIAVTEMGTRHHAAESAAALSRPFRGHSLPFYHVGRAKGPRLSPHQPKVGPPAQVLSVCIHWRPRSSECYFLNSTMRYCSPPVHTCTMRHLPQPSALSIPV